MAGNDPQPGAWRLIGLGSTIAGCVVGGIGLGLLVDWLAGTSPLFLFVGLALGITSACLTTYTQVRNYLS